MLTHRNLVATLTSIIIGIGLHGTKSDAYLAYLPLAHVLELLCELLMCMNGIRVSITVQGFCKLLAESNLSIFACKMPPSYNAISLVGLW